MSTQPSSEYRTRSALTDACNRFWYTNRDETGPLVAPGGPVISSGKEPSPTLRWRYSSRRFDKRDIDPFRRAGTSARAAPTGFPGAREPGPVVAGSRHPSIAGVT